VWGDPDVYDLTPMCTRYIERLVPTDPHKTFLEKKKNIWKCFANKANAYRNHIGLDKENHVSWVSGSGVLWIGPGVGYTRANSVTQYMQCMHTF